MMYLHSIILIHVESYITSMQKIVRKILFNQVPLVTTTNNELINAIIAIYLQNVPENWLATNLNHRLWLEIGFFTKTRSKTASQNNCFHEFKNRASI